MMMLKTLATLLLQVVSLVQSYQHEQLCSCGGTSNNDFRALECAQWDEGGLTQGMLNSIYYTSQEACSGFTEDGIDSCKMNTTYSPQEYCSTTNDGTQVCFIQSPNYSTNQCYSPMTYCVHSVTCPIGSVLYYHNSFLDMTANFPFIYATDYSQCTDTLEVEADYQYYTRCGAATVPTFVSSFGSLLVQFASSKSCQSNGYSMWAICVPLPLSDQLRKQYQYLLDSFGSKKRSSSLNLRTHPAIVEKYLPIVQEVNFSLTLHYNDSTIRIKEHNAVIKTFPAIPIFHLYDAHGELVKTFTKENPTKMNGYGILKVIGRIAHYIEVGIPKELIPSEKEKQLITRLLDFLVPYHVKSKPYDGPQTNEASVNGDSNLSCTDESSCLYCDSAQSKSDEDKILKEAVLCRNENGNPFVQSAVNLAIETIAKKKYCA